MALRDLPPILGLLALAACNPGPERAPGNSETMASGAEEIACAVDGLDEFSASCAVERSTEEGALFLTVRHPNGAFRRFEVLRDGRGVAVADGAVEAITTLDGQTLVVAVETDRYRFPATRASNAARP